MTAINQSLTSLLEVNGAMAAALVDYSSGMLLGSAGAGIDLELAAAGNTEVVRAKLRTMDMLGLGDTIEDMLITLKDQYHLIRPLTKTKAVFVYYVLDRSKANLAMARLKLKSVEETIEV